MATVKDRLMQWLDEADAMEKHAETMLNAIAQRIANYQDVKSKIEGHLQEAQELADALQAYVETRRSEDTSGWKDSSGQRVAMGQGLGGVFAGNEDIKREFTDISCYNLLIEAAAAVGDSETRAVCEEILHREEVMLEWLKKYLASATEDYLDQEENPSAQT